jgi:hypothetical protein
VGAGKNRTEIEIRLGWFAAAKKRDRYEKKQN